MGSFFVLTLSDVIGLVVFAVVILAAILRAVYSGFKVWRCKHPRYFENGQCHGVCRDCGKDLGFIDNLRKARRL